MWAVSVGRADGGAPAEQERSERSRAYERVAAFVEEQLEVAGVAGGAIAIVEQRQLRFAKGLGHKTKNHGAMVDADTLFRIGSITKTFTAALATELAACGVVALDAPIVRYVPELELRAPHDPSTLTLRQLLSHTGGVPNHSEIVCETGDHALAAWFDAHPNLTLWTPPERLYSYSNLGYSLAALVLERATGQSFDDLMREIILDPLGISKPTFDADEARAGNHATGYTQDPSVDPSTSECSLTEGPGGLWAGARDVARLAEVLLRHGDGVLHPSSVWQMRTPHVPTKTTLHGFYGLGLALDRYHGVNTVWHNGAIEGYQSSMLMVPERGFAVVLLINGEASSPLGLTHAIADELLGLSPTPPPVGTTPPETWDDYVGTYTEPDDEGAFPAPWIGTIEVRREDDRLVIRDEDGETYRMRQLYRDTWSVTIEEGELPITFWRDAQGRAEYIATRQGAVRRVDDDCHRMSAE